MTPDTSADDRIREWLFDEAVGELPDQVLTTTFERTRTQRQRRPLPGWRSLMTLVARRPATTPPLRAPWVLILAAILALALAGSALVIGSGLLRTAPPPHPAPLAAVAMPPTACPPDTVLHSGDIATVAGTGELGASGDDGPAIAAKLNMAGMAVDSTGAIYLSDIAPGGIRRVGTDGVISTIASPALHTPFVMPRLMSFDAAGNLFIADDGRIWKRDPTGTLTSVAGTGNDSSSGDDGPAVNAGINAWGVAVGPHGDLYLDDWTRWRTIDTSGVIHPFAGTGSPGFSGDGGPATSATFGGADLGGLAADQQGNVYFGDDVNYRIRKVDPNGIISTFAGTGAFGYSGDGGPATQAALSQVNSIATDTDGSVYFVDSVMHVVRKIDTNGIITTIAGTGAGSYSGDCGPAVRAGLESPGVVVAHDGVVYVSDMARIRMIVP